MGTLIALLQVVHVANAVLMAWPFYALVAVNQRGRLGPPLGDRVDVYMENIIRNRTVPCFVFQGTALASGVALVLLHGRPLGALVAEPVLALKFFPLLLIGGLLLHVHTSLQPRIDGLLAQATGSPASPELAKQLNVFNLSPLELEWVKEGMDDAIAGKKAQVELTEYNSKVQELAKSRRKAQGDKLAVAGKEFLDKAAKEKGAVKTDSGMVYFSLKEGTGESPKATDTVKVHYRGTLPDGKEFDSSYKREKPIDFKLDAVIKCWTEGVQKMKPGGKAKLVCPSSLAYGENGAGDMILPGATLIFEVELLEVVKK